MGRPIKKLWFSVRDGSVNGDLAVTTTSGTEVIHKQVGTGKYVVDSGVVKLMDGVPTVAGEAQLVHNGKNVRKIAQYRIYYFDGTHDVWRSRDGSVVGTFVPDLVGEQAVTAVGTVVPNLVTDANTVQSVTIDVGGSGYMSAPSVTFSTGSGGTATGTAVMNGDAVASVTITDAGSYLDVELPIVVTFGAAASSVSVSESAPKITKKKKKESKSLFSKFSDY